MANSKPIFLPKKFRSGTAKANYPSATTPDTKYKDEGEYKVDIIVDEEQLARFKAAYAEAKKEWSNIQDVSPAQKKALAAGKPKKADPPWDENDDGTYRVRIRRRAITAKGTPQRVKIISKGGKPLTGEAAEFGHGSIVDVGFSVKAWFTGQLGFGVSFMPDIVQVKVAKFEGGGSIDDYGFDVDEDADEEEEGYGFDTEDEDAEEEF
jgi:hypothetical protein